DGLVYAGRVGTGFSDADLRELGQRLAAARRSSCPFTTELTAAERQDAAWVDPVVTGRVRFMRYTETGRLWHPIWLCAAPETRDGAHRGIRCAPRRCSEAISWPGGRSGPSTWCCPARRPASG